MIVDTHAHLAHEDLLSSLEQVLKNAKEKGIEKIICIGCSLHEINKAKQIASVHSNVYFSAGFYPHDNEIGEYKSYDSDSKLNILEDICNEQKCVAIGECGFDFSDPPPWETKRSENEQMDLFIKQISLAKEINKPIIIHSRMATDKTLQTLFTEYKDTNKPNGVWHCFMESYEVLKKVLDLGFYISIGGLITYPKNRFWVKDILEKAPLDRVLLETDAPYLTPHRYRSIGVKINEPAFLDEVVAKLSDVFGKDKDYIEDKTYKNTINLFFKKFEKSSEG